MKEKDILNVGSVVQLVGNTKPLMVVCRAIFVGDSNDQVFYDYGAVLYPEGMYDENMIYFYHDSIAKVLSSPPDDEKEEELKKMIFESCENNKHKRQKEGNNNKGW